MGENGRSVIHPIGDSVRKPVRRGSARHFALATARFSVLGADNGYAAILGWNA